MPVLTIMDAIEIVHRAKEKIERAKRVDNIHEDIRLMESLVDLVEQLQEGLRNSASKNVS